MTGKVKWFSADKGYGFISRRRSVNFAFMTEMNRGKLRVEFVVPFLGRWPFGRRLSAMCISMICVCGEAVSYNG